MDPLRESGCRHVRAIATATEVTRSVQQADRGPRTEARTLCRRSVDHIQGNASKTYLASATLSGRSRSCGAEHSTFCLSARKYFQQSAHRSPHLPALLRLHCARTGSQARTHSNCSIPLTSRFLRPKTNLNSKPVVSGARSVSLPTPSSNVEPLNEGRDQESKIVRGSS